MSFRRFLPLLLAAILLSGCTRYAWVKPVGDQATFPVDTYVCKQEALKSAPPVFETYDSGYGGRRVIRKECHEDHHSERCKTQIVDEPPYTRTVDLNKNLREDLYNACMGARGWVLQAVEEPQN